MVMADRIAKREQTDRVANEIIDAETNARVKKTEKLRELRSARESQAQGKDG